MSTYFIVKMSKHDSFTEAVFTVGKLCERQTSAVCSGDKSYRLFDDLYKPCSKWKTCVTLDNYVLGFYSGRTKCVYKLEVLFSLLLFARC